MGHTHCVAILAVGILTVAILTVAMLTVGILTVGILTVAVLTTEGYWAEQAARQHLLAFSFTNTAPFMVPTGGRTRAVGTKPTCCLG